MLLLVRHLLARRATRRTWARLGTVPVAFTAQLPCVSIRFLVDFYSADQRFHTEAGVSYLVTAAGSSVLFDLGYNPQRERPSPLRCNLQALGLESAGIDGIFISHNHMDHVGGLRNQMRDTPALDQLDPQTLDGVVVWAPVPLHHPRCSCTMVARPTELMPGLASTGPMPAHLYFPGMLHEQALLVSVRGLGVVLITGCGHPGIVEMVRFAKQITGQQVHAVVGGLHLIATRGRDYSQKYLSASQPPWALPGKSGVRKIAEDLIALGVQQVAPSAHDCCDQALGILEEVFGEGYIQVRAGDEVRFSTPDRVAHGRSLKSEH